MARVLDRTNPAHADAVLADLIADEPRRRLALLALARVAELAAELNPASWSITLQHNQIVLNVGQILMARIGRENVTLAGHLGLSSLEIVAKFVQATEPFAVMPGVCLFKVPHGAAELSDVLAVLLPECLTVTREATKSRGPWRRFHSPGAVVLLEQALGHELTWKGPSGAGESAATPGTGSEVEVAEEPAALTPNASVGAPSRSPTQASSVGAIEEVRAETAAIGSGSVGWLHLTDLHQGIGGATGLWPNVLAMAFDDLARLHDLCGPWDLVLFTGDLTQRGTSAQFDELDRSLNRLWTHLDRLGSRPRLVAVPGNHDLVRPDPFDPELLALSLWHTHRHLSDHVLGDSGSRYRDYLRGVFAPYTAWVQRAPWFVRDKVIPGLIPGDFSVSLPLQGLEIGIVGLNSAFLQLTGDDYIGRLDVHPRQLHEVCGQYAPEWLRRHHVNLLMTHHPPEWLEPNARQEFRHEIDVAGRFAAHFFGHMHEGTVSSTSHGGGQPRHAIQGASLFGLEEHIGKDGRGVTRIHGYSAGRFELVSAVGGPQRVRVRIFPRRMFTSIGGRRLAADVSAYDLDDRGSFAYDVPVAKQS